jgi:hypothetical protein
VFPIVTLYESAYRRREEALQALAQLRAAAALTDLALRHWTVEDEARVPPGEKYENYEKRE